MRRSLVPASILVVTALSALGACNPSACIPDLTFPDVGFGSLNRTEDPVATAFTIQGTVNVRSLTGQVSALSGAAVRVTFDRNDDGSITSAEMTEVTSDGSGKYRAELEVPAGSKVVVHYSDDGNASIHKTFHAGPRANIRQNVTLAQVVPMGCSAGRCETEDGRVNIRGLPANFSGSARAFNPVGEVDNFPGAFEDSADNLLISGVYSVVQLTDASGNPVTTMAQPAELRMEVPKDTWNVVKDLRSGTDRIEVPLYSFNEVEGEWVRDGEGFLEDGSGAVLPESTLTAIRAGTHAGRLVVCGNVTHFSYWNLDWPVSTKACLKGLLLDREGRPAEGATIIARGLTYTGYSPGLTIGADGRFCVDVMRSDGTGEDVDQDGITGETQRVVLRTSHRGVVYKLGEFDVPRDEGICPNGNCLDVGTLQISTENEIVPVTCRITGRVLDKLGVGVDGVSVIGIDPGVEGDQLIALCAQGGGCGFATTSTTGGAYELNTAYAEGINIIAIHGEESGGATRNRTGSASPVGCPTAPIDITLSEGIDSYDLMVTVTGNTIAWTPAIGVNKIVVSSGGETTWEIYATGDGGIPPPVTYGVVPSGAVAGPGRDGGIPPLASGDEITVSAGGEGTEGYPYVGSGSATVP